MLETSEPAVRVVQYRYKGIVKRDGEIPSGSVMPRQNLRVPSATPGRNFAFWAAVPKWTIGGTPMLFPPPRPQRTPVTPLDFSLGFHIKRGKAGHTTREISSVKTRVCHESHSLALIPPGNGTSKPVTRARYPREACLLKTYTVSNFHYEKIEKRKSKPHQAPYPSPPTQTQTG